MVVIRKKLLECRKQFLHQQQKEKKRLRQKHQKHYNKMTISYTLKKLDDISSHTIYEHNYSCQKPIRTIHRAGKRQSMPANVDHTAVLEICKLLLNEAEKVSHEDEYTIDKESLQSFNEYAKYLELVNPICSPDSVDTADKLVINLGM